MYLQIGIYNYILLPLTITYFMHLIITYQESNFKNVIEFFLTFFISYNNNHILHFMMTRATRKYIVLSCVEWNSFLLSTSSCISLFLLTSVSSHDLKSLKSWKAIVWEKNEFYFSTAAFSKRVFHHIWWKVQNIMHLCTWHGNLKIEKILQ